MVYDPQREHRRPRPSADDPAPVDAYLDGNHSSLPDRPAPTPTPDDPPPPVRVTPDPADPWSDRLLFGTGITTVATTIVGLLVLRWLWLRRRRSGRDPGSGR